MGTAVLVADDSGTARKLLIRALPKDWEISVTHAANGSEALTAYRAARPGVVFLDLNMPVMDGYAVLEALKDDTDKPPIIVLTGDIQPLAQARVLALGAKAFLKKPVSEQQIADVLRECGLR